MDISLKLKNTPECGKNKNIHINFNLNELRNTPNELEINDGTGKDEISKLITEKENTKYFSNWSKYNRRRFNTKLRNKAKPLMNNTQENSISAITQWQKIQTMKI